MRRAPIILAMMVCAMLFAHASADAQNWKNILQLDGTFGASAFFFNASEGLIGTGHYASNIPAQIYYTNNGGASWRLTQFANPNIHGQVTDIYFRDRQNGWATISEFLETGWSGIYHSTDGGMTWARVKQAGFPAGIRETSRGVFYTDRDIDPGVMFSSDTGKTWTHVATTGTTLGIDFMDDSTGFVTTQAAGGPHLYTTDGGASWQSITTSSEAWTPYGDPVSRSFFLASERDQLTFTTQTTVVKVPVGSWTESKIRDYGDSGITGGIAGSHVCQSVIYVQGREPAQIAPGGIIRSMDAGQTWKFVGGPNNINDKRFAVTGRGAVVIAFDDSGGVWSTTDGGDGTLSPSVLPFVTLILPKDTVQATMCDSAIIPIVLGYSVCDSAQIASVTFVNDSLNECSTPAYDNDFRFFSSARMDTLKILYRPAQPETRTMQVTLTIRQPDGYTEDTTIRILLEAVPSKANALVFSGTTAPDTIDFDSVSICSDAFQSVTMTNLGCGDIAVDSIRTSGLPFSLVSNVQPFILNSGNSRSFLIHYTPDSVRSNRGKLYITNSAGVADTTRLDSVVLLGTGYSSGDAVSLSIADSIRSSGCDSAAFTITLRNVACKAFAIDSIITNAPFRVESIPSIDSVRPGDEISLPFIFVPNAVGSDTGTIYLVISYAGTGRYDTILQAIGIGTIGKSNFSTARDALSMGTVAMCSDASDTLLVYSSGCGDITVSAAFDVSNGFSLARAPKPVLSSPDSDTVIVEYHPNDSIGRVSANLIFTTSTGTDTVPVSITVVSGGGTVAFSVTPNIQAFLCESQPFSVTIANDLCDSIAIDSIALGGANADDFSLTNAVPFALGPGGQTTLHGIFTPQDSLTRSVSVSFTIREADGTMPDTTILVAGQGISVPPIQVALGVTILNAGVGQTVIIPIISKRGSATAVSAFDFTLLFNTDLLSPLPLTTSADGFFGNVGTETFALSKATNGSHIDTVTIHLQLNVDAILPVDTLFQLVCQAYVTSAVSTDVTLHEVQFRDASGSAQCLASETVPDTNATFLLNQACGDTILTQVLANETLVLDGVSPNPTTGLVRLTFEVPDGYATDAMLEIYNTLGEKLGEQPLVFSAATNGSQTFDLDLNNGVIRTNGGILYLRIRTSLGFLTAKVIVLEP
jgi:photosystem II stability/assembly factor-like uncharacterized protein